MVSRTSGDVSGLPTTVESDHVGTAEGRAMASKDTGGQKRASKNSEEVDEVDASVDTSADVAERKDKIDQDIDAILDDIDAVLESNSEDFVRGFVQKGGQ